MRYLDGIFVLYSLLLSGEGDWSINEIFNVEAYEQWTKE